MFWDNVYRNRHIMQEFEDTEVHKTSVSVFVALFYLEMLYILIMTLSILNRYGITTMIENMGPLECLYLSKEQNIYIDICKLPQHQINGVRFIYRQFKKENKGIIINDPTGYGKTLQVVLFLNATRSLLSKSTLILCNKDRANNWVRHFQKWKAFHDDEIFIESSNPYRKKMSVCINTVNNIETFAQRPWSVVVIEDNENTKAILKTKFKATYKIWITSEDMKKNLRSFSQIHNWLKPDDPDVSRNVDDTIKNVLEGKKIVDKSMLLDALMRDVVLRRNNYVTSINKVEEISNTNVLKSKMSRKNKDVTGTKIKRSKRITDVGTSEVSDDNPYKCINKTPEVNPNILSENKNEKQAAMDVETFISTQKLIEPEVFKGQKDMEIYENPVDENIRVENDAPIQNNVSHVDSKFDDFNNFAISSKDTDFNGDNELGKPSTDLKDSIKDEKIQNRSTTMEYDTDIEMSDNTSLNNKVAETKCEVKSFKSDAKMKEMEEKYLKKFKGSFLDSIF